MPTVQVNLPVELDNFVSARVESGRYGNVDEVIQAALRGLERDELEDDAKLEALGQALDAGLASGLAEGDVFAQVRARAGLRPRDSFSARSSLHVKGGS